jgi:lipopolysaccharide export system permease protein
MLKRLDFYLLGQIAWVAALLAFVLTGLMLMIQSLRFLDLIIQSGASGLAFVTLSLLALPRFFEVIVPVALAASTVFVLLRLGQDGELTVMQGAGMAPARMGRAALVLAGCTSLALFGLLGWGAPATLAQMQEMRQLIKTQFSTALFRPGVFNSMGDHVTIYVANRREQGRLEGLMIHDARPENPTPVTILARAGQLVATPEGQRIIVYQGARQAMDTANVALQTLAFERYVIDLPEPAATRKRWAEPEERTLDRLLWRRGLDAQESLSPRQQNEFRAEIYRRFLSPLLAVTFIVVTLALVLTRPFVRATRAMDYTTLGLVIITLQALYIGAFSMAKGGAIGLTLMGAVVVVPLVLAIWLITRTQQSRIMGTAR